VIWSWGTFVQSVKDIRERLIVVPGNHSLSREAQESAMLTFRMHLRARFASCRVLEQSHLTREACGWMARMAGMTSAPSVAGFLSRDIQLNVSTPLSCFHTGTRADSICWELYEQLRMQLCVYTNNITILLTSVSFCQSFRPKNC
jgi:hypothetical protein